MSPAPNAARRNPQSQQAILAAAHELALEIGPAKVTIEGIASRAGVGKQTIYRWWPSKGALLLDALDNAAGRSIDMPDTGDVAADLTAQMTAVADLFDSKFGQVYGGLIAEAQADPALASKLAQTLLSPRVAAFADRLRKGQKAGQIRADADVEAAVEVLCGALYYRFLLHTGPLTREYVAGVVELVLSGLGPAA